MIAVLALGGLAIAQLVGGGDRKARPAAAPSGDPLEGPVITPPVKKQGKRER